LLLARPKNAASADETDVTIVDRAKRQLSHSVFMFTASLEGGSSRKWGTKRMGVGRLGAFRLLQRSAIKLPHVDHNTQYALFFYDPEGHTDVTD
jgi:hypothetical protein